MAGGDSQPPLRIDSYRSVFTYRALRARVALHMHLLNLLSALPRGTGLLGADQGGLPAGFEHALRRHAAPARDLLFVVVCLAQLK